MALHRRPSRNEEARRSDPAGFFFAAVDCSLAVATMHSVFSAGCSRVHVGSSAADSVTGGDRQRAANEDNREKLASHGPSSLGYVERP